MLDWMWCSCARQQSDAVPPEFWERVGVCVCWFVCVLQVCFSVGSLHVKGNTLRAAAAAAAPFSARHWAAFLLLFSPLFFTLTDTASSLSSSIILSSLRQTALFVCHWVSFCFSLSYRLSLLTLSLSLCLYADRSYQLFLSQSPINSLSLSLFHLLLFSCSSHSSSHFHSSILPPLLHHCLSPPWSVTLPKAALSWQLSRW